MTSNDGSLYALWEDPETQADDMLRHAGAVDFRKVLMAAYDCVEPALDLLTVEQLPHARAVRNAVLSLTYVTCKDKELRRALVSYIRGLESGSISHETNLAGSAFKELALAGIMYIDGKLTSSLVHPCANAVFNAARAVACSQGFVVEDDSFGPDELPEFVDDEAAFRVSREWRHKVLNHIPLSLIDGKGEPEEC